MCHRVRTPLAHEDFKKLVGTVEVDDTFVGGEAENRHIGKRGNNGGTGSVGKAIVAGAVSHKGTVVARMVARTSAAILQAFAREASLRRSARCFAATSGADIASSIGIPPTPLLITPSASTSSARSTRRPLKASGLW